MKKNIIFIGLFLCSFSLFSKTAEEYYQDGMLYENNHKYIYAMSEFYDSMIMYPNKESFKSYYEFLRLRELIRNGYPGYVIESTDADYASKWEKLLLEFYQFWTENGIHTFSICSTIQETKDELILNCQFAGKYTEKFYISSSIISNGFHIARKKSEYLLFQYNSWAETSSINSIDRFYISAGFPKYGDAYHTRLIASSYGTLPYSESAISFDFYDFDGNYIATTDIKIIQNGSVFILNNYISLPRTAERFYIDINCFNESGKNKILNGTYQVKIKNYFLLGDKSNREESSEDWVIVNKENVMITDEKGLTSNITSILAYFEEEVKRNDISNNIDLIKEKNIDELIKKYFVLVEGGKFEMGNTENPTGSVTINSGFRSFTYTDKYLAEQIPVHIEDIDSFYMMNIEVPVYFYNLIMKNIDDSSLENITLPIESISWYDAVKFCNILSSFYGLELCYYWQNDTVKCNFEANGFRLPTEVEWEYAARGGAHSSGYRYSGTNYYGDVMPEYRYLEEVRSGIPNELNIYNMSGNVSEWCWDWYTSYDLENQAPTAFKVVRGGNYNSSVKEITVYARDGFYPNALYNRGIGIRIVKKASD